MTLEERNALLAGSYSEDRDDLNPVRYAVRRIESILEWYQTKLTLEHPDGRIEIHGYPFTPQESPVPTSVLRQMRDSNAITKPEYNKALKRQG
jgi:hypothetical protein